jgi:hypothetical protein
MSHNHYAPPTALVDDVPQIAAPFILVAFLPEPA